MSVARNLSRKPKICVVGAGFSGLVCAERLGRQGFDVTVLEARDRVGGRVHQLKTIGHWTDMGANWIHGAPVNPIRDLAQKVGSVIIDPLESPAVHDEDGSLVPAERASKLEEAAWSLVGEAFQHSSTQGNIAPSLSLKDFINDQLKTKKDLSDRDKRTVLQISEFFGGYVGSPFERQSLKYLFLEAGLEGENGFIASTYRDILKVVSEGAQKQAAIHMETEVTSIDAPVTPIHMEGDQLVAVRTKPSASQTNLAPNPLQETNYDAVVVTVPFGCLKEGQISISPPVPPQLTHAVQSISYGNLEKVWFRFPRAFWHSSGGHSPIFRQFLHPQYAPENPRGWNMSMMSFADGPREDVSYPTLLFYIHGPCSSHVTALVRGIDQSSPEYAKRLESFFKPYYSLLPSFDANDPDCTPAAVLATDWQHDRLAGHGSYTNWQIDDNEKHGLPPKMALDEAIKVLRHGLPERNVYFAGEHTAPFSALGTVTGAYLSGEAVAERLVKRYAAERYVGLETKPSPSLKHIAQ